MLFPYTTLFRSLAIRDLVLADVERAELHRVDGAFARQAITRAVTHLELAGGHVHVVAVPVVHELHGGCGSARGHARRVRGGRRQETGDPQEMLELRHPAAEL